MTKRLLIAAAFPLLLLALNVYIAWNLFSLEYSQFMGSIEAAYVAISRYIISNWGDLTWFPLWYGGIPFQNTYPPLLHLMVAGFAAASGMSPVRSHHAVTAMLYALGPVAVYFLAVRLTRSRWFSFWAALAYSVLSPSAFLISQVRGDLGTIWAVRRFQVLLVYGEGPHVSALTFLPVALLCLDYALGKRRPAAYLLAALSMDAVALTNWLGSFALALAVIAYLVATSWNGSDGSWRRRWMTTAALALLAYLLSCPWIPPSTIRAIGHNAQYVGDYQHVYRRLLLYAALGSLAIAAAKIAFRRWKLGAPLQFFVLFALMTAGITLGSEWFGIAVVPQPNRYHLEMEMALCLAVTFALQPLCNRLSGRYRVALACTALVLCILPVRYDRRYARRYVKPIDVTKTIEYQSAKWLDSQFAGTRVMLPGSISYWLNAFTDTPQFAGGFEQGIANPTQPRVAYQIMAATGSEGKAAEISIVWFKAYGIGAVGTQGPKSRESFKAFRDSERFDGLLPLGTRDGDDAILLVPGGRSLAHVIPAEAVVSTTPVNGLDVDEAARYVAALDDPKMPLARLRWTSRHSVELEAELRPGEVVSFQEAYHPGWHASVNGKPLPVSRDGLGQMIVRPEHPGHSKIEFAYDGGVEMKIAHMLSWSALAGCLVWVVFSRRSSSARVEKKPANR